MKNLAEQLKSIEPKMVSEIDLGNTTIFEIDGNKTPISERGKQIFNILEKQFKSRRMVYCSTSPCKITFEKKGRKYIHSGYNEVSGYHYTVLSFDENDENNFHIIF